MLRPQSGVPFAAAAGIGAPRVGILPLPATVSLLRLCGSGNLSWSEMEVA